MSTTKEPPAASRWTPPADWRPYTAGNPGAGRRKVLGQDGKAYSRPATPEELAAGPGKTPAGSAEARLTVPRLAMAMRDHMQMKEKFLAVMDEANLSDKAAENLIQWLKEWRTQAALRQIQQKQAALQKIEAEISALRRVATT